MKLGSFLNSKLDKFSAAPYTSTKPESSTAKNEIRLLQLRGRAVNISITNKLTDSKLSKSKKNQVQPLPSNKNLPQQQHQNPVVEEKSIPLSVFRAVKKSIPTHFTRSSILDKATPEESKIFQKLENSTKRSVLSIRSEQLKSVNSNVSANYSKENFQKTLIAQIPAFSKRISALQKNTVNQIVKVEPKSPESAVNESQEFFNVQFRPRITHQVNSQNRVASNTQSLNLINHRRDAAIQQNNHQMDINTSSQMNKRSTKKSNIHPSSSAELKYNNCIIPLQRMNTIYHSKSSLATSSPRVGSSSKTFLNPIASPYYQKPNVGSSKSPHQQSARRSRKSRGKIGGMENRKKLLKIACLNTIKTRLKAEGKKSIIDFAMDMKKEFKYLRRIL